MLASERKLKEWREHPVQFVEECLHATPDAWQTKVLEAWPHRQRIALKACKGPGKSTVMSWCAWNFLVTRPHPKCIATSITGDNLRDGLWAEMSKWQQKSDLLQHQFEWNVERIFNREAPETWFLSARSWAKSADASQQANTLAGIHADYVAIFVDEAGGIPSGVVAAAEGGLMTGKETHLFICGNPTHLTGPLYDACTSQRRLWFVVEITGDPDRADRSPRIDLELCKQQIAEHGREDPWVMVNILGQFPPGQSNALLGVEEVGEAARRKIGEREYRDEVKILGVDVARFGDDQSVILMRQGRAVFRPRRMRDLDTGQLGDQILMVMNEQNPNAVFIDATGIGSGVTALLQGLGHSVVGVDFGSPATEPKRYRNKRCEMWWRTREWVKKQRGCIPDDPALRSELTAPTYWYDPSNKFCLESKEDLKKRGKPSPDTADALALTFAYPVAHKSFARGTGERGQRNRVRSDFEPYREN